MSFFKQIILIIIGIILFFSSLSARMVEIWPGINKMGKYNILTHLSDYSNMLNYVVISNNGKKELFPLPTELTYRLVKKNLVIIANNLAVEDTKFYVDNMNLINEYYEKTNKTLDNIKNNTDPFYLLATAFTMLVNMNTGTKQSDENVDKIATIIKSNISVYIESLLSGGDPRELIRNAIYKPLCDIVVKFYNVDPNKHPMINFLISKFADITGDGLYEAIKFLKEGKKGLTKIPIKMSKKITIEGIWTALAAWQNFIEAIVNSGKMWNILFTVDKLSNNTDNMIIHNYIAQFIKDYVEKYNMNINLMANDSAYCFDWAFNGSCIIYSKPHNFFQLFVIYGLSHGYLKEINLNSSLIKDLWLLAHQTLYLIENFGDGGNNKIILDIDDNGNIKINNESYILNQLYWMLPINIKDKVFGYMIYNVKHNIFIADNDLKNYNPYYVNDNDINNNRYINTKKHINVTFKYYETVNLNLQGKYIYIDNLEKTINYNGILEENGINISNQVYNKIITKFNKLYIPLYKVELQTKEQQEIINKLIPTGIVPKKSNLALYLLSFVTKEDVKNTFEQFEYLTNSKFYSKNKLNELLKNLKDTYITKGEFLYFIEQLFYNKIQNYNYYLPFNKNIPYYVALLYNNGIIKKVDVDLNDSVTNIEMFMILYRISRLGEKNETK